MKVLIWTNNFPVYSETFIRDHIIGLIDRGITVFIHSDKKTQNNDVLKGFENYTLENYLNTPQDYIPKSIINRIFNAFYILLNSLGSSNFRYYLKSLNVFKFKRKASTLRYFFLLHFIIKNEINVVHAHFGTNGRKLVFLKQISYPIKLITTFHGYDTRFSIEYSKYLYKDLFKYSDKIISISAYNTKKLLEFGASPLLIKRINNGVKSCMSKADKNNINIINIVSIGRLVPEKNYKLALKVLSLYKNENPEVKFKYHIIGGGDKKKDLQKLVEDLQLENEVIFYGYKTSSFIIEVLPKFDFLLLSSKKEALPTVILEAQSCSLPVLATDVGSVSDIVNSNNGVLSKVNEVDFLKGLNEMMSLKEDWKRLGENGKRQVSTFYDQNKQLDLIVELYSS